MGLCVGIILSKLPYLSSFAKSVRNPIPGNITNSFIFDAVSVLWV